MAKKLFFPTRSFGSDSPQAGITELSEWVGTRSGKGGDLLLYRLEKTLIPQIEAGIGMPCAGGPFYDERILECTPGIRERKIAGELWLETGLVEGDGRIIRGHSSCAWCAIPAPSLLDLDNEYYSDDEDALHALCSHYQVIMREMRDQGVAGHVIVADGAVEEEIERLSGKKTYFYITRNEVDSLSTLLEYQRDVAVVPGDLDVLAGLSDEFRVGTVTLCEPDRDSLGRLLEWKDRDQVMAGGYCREDCPGYWKRLVESSVFTQ
ncbi:hypothetical protein J2741_001908 [Methanolinea mesophila]|uniref:hypothetical protein n=1 Tax=Methanolinea mesophila TaxID=547055 RepID=UPI001AEB18E2|nr:hypothetical protein [Methanolinea mesophila]MBP1929361.1 hypothetical protein [Methanolinea mesophila]